VKPAIFWDRDGTLMKEVEYCSDPRLVEAIPGSGEALKALLKRGFLNVLVTNQSGIGRGYFTIEDYHAVNRELIRQLGLQLDGSYFCPDSPERATHRRKPSTGMIEEACRDLPIDIHNSWFVGDKAADIECGQRAGCRTILVETGYGKGQLEKCQPDYVATDAAKAAQQIVSQHEKA